MKKIFVLCCAILMLGVKMFLMNSDVPAKKAFKEYRGSVEFWGDRVGRFSSDSAFSKTLKKVRKQITKIPKRRSLGLNWEELGPDNIGGRTRAILIDKSNTNRVYAGGVSGGLWYSNDGGLSWEATTPGDNAEVLTVNCITQDKDGYIYYGTGEGVFYGDNETAPGIGGFGFRGMGVFRSTTPSGTEFTHLNDSWDGKEERTVAVNALTADTLGNIYAAAKNKLYRSTDNGLNWNAVNAYPNGIEFSGIAYDVAVTPSGVVVLAMGNNYFVSFTGAPYTFYRISTNEIPAASGRSVIAIAPSDDNTIYVSRALKTGEFDGLYRTKDGGYTWDAVVKGASDVFKPFTGGGPQGEYNQCLAVYPNNPNRIILGGIEFYRWEEGENWEKITRWSADWGDHDYVHADGHTIVFHPENPEMFYLGTDGGVFRTKNDAEIFERLNRGFNVTQYYGLSFGRDGVVLGGVQDNANIYVDFKGNTEQSGDVQNSGDGGQACISQLNPEAFFIESQYGKIKRSNKRGEEYNEFFSHAKAKLTLGFVEHGGEWSEFVAPLDLWESNSDNLVKDSIKYVADKTYYHGDILSLVSTNTKVLFSDTLKSDYEKGDTITVKDRHQSMFLYGTHQALYISRNVLDFSKSPEWIELSRDGCLVDKWNSKGISAFATSADGNVIFYGTNKGEVFRVSNVSQVVNEETVSNATVLKIADLETTSGADYLITDIAIDPNDPERVLVSVGFYDQPANIYYSNLATSTMNDSSFIPVSGDLPQIPVYSCLIEYYSGAFIIGTEFGVFTSEDNGITWSKESDGLPNCPTLMVRQQNFKWAENFGQIYIATHGRGVFTSDDYVTSVGDETALIGSMDLKIFPNPVINTLSFKLLTSLKVDEILIFDIKGSLVLKENNIPNSAINVNHLQKGLYIINVKAGSKIYNSKFIKK